VVDYGHFEVPANISGFVRKDSIPCGVIMVVLGLPLRTSMRPEMVI